MKKICKHCGKGLLPFNQEIQVLGVPGTKRTIEGWIHSEWGEGDMWNHQQEPMEGIFIPEDERVYP